MKKFLSILLSVCMIIASVGTVVLADSLKFTDVDASTAEGAAIYKLAEAGVVNGNGDGTFSPNSGLTRAELCKMVNLVFGYKEADTVQFTDVSADDWFAPYVLVAKKAGYINGYEDGSFRGNNNITREEFCAILCRVASVLELGIKAPISDGISDWAVEYVNKVVANSLMSLEDGNKFRATENMKRSEIAVVLAKFVNKTPATNPGGSVSIGGSSSGGSSSGGSSSGGSSSGGSSSGGSSSGGSSSGGSSSGGSSSGGSSSGGSSSGGSTDDTPTPEEYIEMNKTVVEQLSTASKSLSANKAKFRGAELTIVNTIIEVVDKTIADNDKYEISTETIAEHYLEKVKAAKDAYDAMSEGDQSLFKTKISDIDQETFDFLVDFFGIEI